MDKKVDIRYYDCFECLRKACQEANNTFSWSGKIDPSIAYTKATKEYLNSVLAEYLFLKFRVTKGWNVSEYRLKSHIIQRILRKGELWDIYPYAKEYLENHGMREEDVLRFLFDVIRQEYPGAYDYVQGIFSISLTKEEEELFNVAKTVATWIEFEKIKNQMTYVDRRETRKEIKQSMSKINVSEYFEQEEIDLFVKLSNAARMVRWAKYVKPVPDKNPRRRHTNSEDEVPTLFTDAMHMLLTALLAEVTTLEYRELGLIDETVDPTRVFFKALMHDSVEVWTGDAPSPCKNKILFEGVGKNLRKVFEEFEMYVYQKFFFKPMDPQIQKEFIEKVVFDEGDDPGSKIVKNADYFSADVECYLTIVSGVTDKNYFRVLRESYEKSMRNAENGFSDLRVRTPAATEILTIFYEFSKTKTPAPI